MILKEYIEWTKTIDDYETAPNVANTKAWGFKKIKKVNIPEIKIENAKDGDEGYWSSRNEKLTEWAREQWEDLTFLDTKIQIQKPGQVCKPHLDFLGYYLEDICMAHPGLLKLKHSLDAPAIDIWRMFIAVEDQVWGQRFVINDWDWIWKAGDCMRLNNWQALHWTKNTSSVDRTIIKVTGVKF
jgi:hypothetical protein